MGRPRLRDGVAVRAILLAAWSSCVTSAGAHAEAPMPAPWMYERMATAPFERGQFYLGFTLNGGVQQLPRFNSTASVVDAGPIPPIAVGPSPFDVDIAGPQPGGEIGYVFRDGTFPAWAGTRVRAAAFGSVFFARGTRNATTAVPPTPNGGLAVIGVDGNFLLLTSVPTSTFAESLKIHRESFQVGLKLESDVALGPGLSLTPAIAVFGGRVHDTYEHAAAILLPNAALGIDVLPLALNERLRTTEIGGYLGARLTWQFRPGWALHFGGTAGPVWMRTRLTASNCVNDSVVPAGTPCGPANPGFASSFASDRKSTVGFRGTASLGLAADLRYAILSLGGYMRYDSRIPGIQNPQLVTFSQLPPFAPARVRFDDGFAYGGYLTLRVPIH